MSVSVRNIVGFMEELAPCGLAAENDNVGLLVGCSTYETDRILVALDAVSPVIDEAIEKKCGMIVTHHPLFRAGQKRINDESAAGRKIIKLIENSIALYAAHTNLDKAAGGVNDCLCEVLELENVQVKKAPNGDNDFLRVGELKEPVTVACLAEKYQKKLGLLYLPIVGDRDRLVKKAAVVSGNGMGLLAEVINSGVDVFISGDIRYHDANDAIEAGLSMLDITHYASEAIFAEPIKRYLEEKRDLNGLSYEVLVSEVNGQPFWCL